MFSLTAASALEVGPGAVAQFSGFTGGVFSFIKDGEGTLLLTSGTAVTASFHTELGTILDNVTISNSNYDSIGRLTNDNGAMIVRGNAAVYQTNDFNVADAYADIMRPPDCPDPTFNSTIQLDTGAVIETHDLVSSQSLGQIQQLHLKYNSLAADPRPIVNFGWEGMKKVHGYHAGCYGSSRPTWLWQRKPNHDKL